MEVKVLESRDVNRETVKPVKKKKEKLSALCKTPPQVIRTRTGQDYQRGSFLGEGGFARCFQVKDNSGKIFAAKTVAKASLKSGKTKTKLIAEIKIHKSLQHPNVVQFVDCFEDDTNVYILLEICRNQSLMDMLRQRKTFTENEARYFIVQILGAVSYMHARRVIHRDLKLGNIFLDDDMNVKIGDFGLATIINTDGDRKNTICGTPNYIAPEVLFGKDTGHSFEVDIWSTGIILYAMLFGKPPFQCKEVNDIYERIKYNSYSFPANSAVSDEARDLIRSLLNPNPDHRPSISDILSHKFFHHDFPKRVPVSTLSARPNWPPIPSHESTLNFKLCRYESQLKLEIDTKPRSIKSRSVTPVQITRDDLKVEQSAVLPLSLSPASTKDKYKMVLVKNRTSGLDLKQQQQQQQRLSGAKLTREEPRVEPPRWTRATSVESTKLASSSSSSSLPRQAVTVSRSLSNGKATADHLNRVLTQVRADAVPATRPQGHEPTVFLSKWVDFSDKYGLAYQLSSDNIGVLFRNNSILLREPHVNVYLKLNSSEGDSARQAWRGEELSSNTSDPSDAKNIRLINTSYRYMQENLRKQDVSFTGRPSMIASPVFVTQYERKAQYVMFYLNTGTFQFNFPDHNKVMISKEGTQIDLLDAHHVLHTWTTEEAVLFAHRAASQGRRDDAAYGLMEKLVSCLNAIRDVDRVSV